MNNAQVDFIEEINEKLKNAISLASQDYTVANGLFKKCYAVSKKQILVGGDTDIDSKIETVLAGLQYMDVFTQRVEHLIATHQYMNSTDLAVNFEESFFHLHVFQAMTIELDLIKSTAIVKTLLHELAEQLGESYDQSLFIHTASLKEVLQQTITVLLNKGGERNRLPIPSLTAEQIRVLNSLYTMESERVVLGWFLKSMPGGTWEELIHHYEYEIDHVSDDNTDLF